ncbi:MAG: amidohydrolase family protein [Kofleriaceae bacterium]|nr:amidohydrolase family protein [Kofleriaceae bacterium]
MRRIALALVVLFVACKGDKPAAKKEVLQAGDLALVGATVVPMDREGTLADQIVVVRGDKIALVAPSAQVDTKAATVVDVKGKWIVPGLADMHVHTWVDKDFPMYLLNGVTTIRDMFGSPQHLAWKKQIQEGTLDAPTLFTAGPIVDGDPPVWPGSAVVKTADEARAVVREQKAAGYDFIKVYNNLSTEAYDAIAAEAKAQNIPFAGHVPKAAGLDKVLASGQRTIEHLDGYVPFGEEAHVSPDIIAATVKAGTWNCPTLVVTERFAHLDNLAGLESTAGLQYVAPVVKERWNPKNDFRLKSWTPEMFAQARAKNDVRRKLVADLQKAGAKLVLGTDTGNPYVVPGFAVHDELALLVKSGLTPWQALRMATAAPAELVGQPGAFGTIVPGARADLVVVDADPLRDIGALATPSRVVVRGKMHERSAMLAALDAAKPPADPYAKLPALEAEGEKLATANYAIEMGTTVIGHERALISKLADKTFAVRGQAVYDMPALVLQYRATPDALEIADVVSVKREGTKVIAKPAKGAQLELATAADAVIAPQTIAEFVWYATRLSSLKVGATKALTAAEVMMDNALQLVPASFTFKRLDDQDGRRRYELSGKNGKLDVTGQFSVDADGAPHVVEITVPWGKFVTKRID